MHKNWGFFLGFLFILFLLMAGYAFFTSNWLKYFTTTKNADIFYKVTVNADNMDSYKNALKQYATTNNIKINDSSRNFESAKIIQIQYIHDEYEINITGVNSNINVALFIKKNHLSKDNLPKVWVDFLIIAKQSGVISHPS
jgi:hypothetical protein